MGDWQRAARLFGAAEALLKAAGTTLWPSNGPDYDRNVAASRSHTDESNFYVAWVEGRAMSVTDALDLAKDASATEPPRARTVGSSMLARAGAR
jgi:sugar (pentulose or hexulose) kinase